MTDLEFIEFCYLNFLKRSPDEQGKQEYINALKSNTMTREEIFNSFINCDEFKFKFISEEFVPPGHFYSALPSLEDKQAFLETDQNNINEIEGININTEKQVDLLKLFKLYYDQCPFPENKTIKFRYYFLNQSYSFTDAIVLYSMIRHLKPKRIIEIGSGFSSSAMLDTNDLHFNGEIDFTFIEPYPKLLKSLLKRSDAKYSIHAKKLQDVDLNMFSSLEANDILFIDSTHVSKLNSDVNMIFFDILPLLQKGVIIHFHDIFYPFEYPKDWIREGRVWNETYMLRAFLQFNESFEIHFFASYLHSIQHQWILENMPKYLYNKGGNIWLRKIK